MTGDGYIRFCQRGFLSIFSCCLLQGCDLDNPESSMEMQGPPVAIKTLIDPTKEEPKGSKIRIEYSYGVLVVDRRYTQDAKVEHESMFFDIDTAWPDFGDRYYYSKSEQINRVRFLFEIRKTTPLNDLYKVFLAKQYHGEVKKTPLDTRFPALLGYGYDNPSRGEWYIAKDIATPGGTPLAIGCSSDDSIGQDGLSKQGSCRYTLIIDPDLRIQVRFNKPLLKEFPTFYQKANHFIESFREPK